MTRPGRDQSPSAFIGLTANEWIDRLAAEASERRRRSAGPVGLIRRNLGRARTVLRLYGQVGVRDATAILVQELRR